MFTDFIINTAQGLQGHGEVGRTLQGVRWEVGMLRPYLKWEGGRNVPYVTINSGRMVNDGKGGLKPERIEASLDQLARRQIYSPVANATSLRKEEWIRLDQQVQMVQRRELKAWGDIAARVPYGGFNGMAKMTLEYEAMSDPGKAYVDMEMRSLPTSDMPLFNLRSVPLPLTQAGFTVGSRKLAESRNTGTPLDMTMPEACSRRVAEEVEKTLIGTVTGMTYGTVTTGPTAHTGTSTVYGYTNFPFRNVKTNFTAPNTGGWVANTTYNEFLTALELLRDDNYRGPFLVYHSRDWSQYMDQVFSISGGNNPGETLRTMLRKIDGIEDVVRLDYLDSTFTLIFVQMTSDVIQAVDGMGMTTFQWETLGGAELNFRVACIHVPRFKYDYLGQSGLLHGTTA